MSCLQHQNIGSGTTINQRLIRLIFTHTNTAFSLFQDPVISILVTP